MIIGLLQDSFNVGNMCMICTLRKSEIQKETNRQNLLYILNTSTILVIQFIGTVIIWVVGAQEVFKGNMTIGTIMALMNYQTIIMNPIIGIAQFANEYHTAVVSLKDINGLLQYPDQKQGDGKKVTTVNNISLEEMSFSYPESNKKVFDRLNLKFEKALFTEFMEKVDKVKALCSKL